MTWFGLYGVCLGYMVILGMKGRRSFADMLYGVSLFNFQFHCKKHYCYKEHPVKRIKRSVCSKDPTAYTDIT